MLQINQKNGSLVIYFRLSVIYPSDQVSSFSVFMHFKTFVFVKNSSFIGFWVLRTRKIIVQIFTISYQTKSFVCNKYKYIPTQLYILQAFT